MSIVWIETVRDRGGVGSMGAYVLAVFPTGKSHDLAPPAARPLLAPLAALSLLASAASCGAPPAAQPPPPPRRDNSFFPWGEGGAGAEQGALERAGVIPAGIEGHPRLILSPPVLEAQRALASAGGAEWLALRARCEEHVRGKVEWPDGEDYPAAPGVGEGYQGDGYFDALVDLGLCYQIAKGVERDRALAYADSATAILARMSASDGHAVNPLRDSGYGVRFYVLGMAIGYDWLFDALNEKQRERLRGEMGRWLAAYEQGGFGRDHPQGNYFAGYYAAKALASLATAGEPPPAGVAARALSFEDWLTRVHLKMVQPYYAAHMRGGGWPEGWQYGSLATVNMVWPTLAVRSARSIDLVHRPGAAFDFPAQQAAHLVHYTWPSLRTLDDRGTQYANDNPSTVQASLVTPMYGVLAQLGDPFAPTFHSYARAVREAQATPAPAWQDMLFWPPRAAEVDFRSLPRSYVSQGMQSAAMRSSWARDAVWASFTSGTYVGSVDSGEMYFDQGSLVVVRGGQALLCNAHTGLLRNTPGTTDGAGAYDLVYADIYGKKPPGGGRTLHNVFYVDGVGGQQAVGPDEAHTRLAAFEDGGTYVLARGVDLAQMYRAKGSDRIRSWTRQVLFVRPGLFVVDDRTDVSNPAADQMMAFHLCGPAATRRAGHLERVELGAPASPLAAVTPVLPDGNNVSIVDVFGRGKVRRAEVRAGARTATQRWLTVVEAATGAEPLHSVTRLPVEGGDGDGVVLAGGGSPTVVVAGRPAGTVAYRAPAGASTHLLTGMQPGASYSLSASPVAGGVRVRLAPGAGRPASAAGVLTFRVEAGAIAAP
jgi:hypothetical protein